MSQSGNQFERRQSSWYCLQPQRTFRGSAGSETEEDVFGLTLFNWERRPARLPEFVGAIIWQ